MTAAAYDPQDSSVERGQKHTRTNPCPICGGGDDDKRHQGIRCKLGFTSKDERYAHCGNADYAGGLPLDKNGFTRAHRLDGPCRCGDDHSASVAARPANVVNMRPRTITRAHQNHTPIATHVYRNRDRSIRFRVARFWSKRTGPPTDAPTLPKCLPQREDSGWRGEWIDGLDGAPYAGLYLLPELVEADPFAPVFIPEGEGKVDKLVELGEVATCHAGGAKKWGRVPADDLEALRGRQVVLLTDNDDASREDAAQGVALLLPIAASVRVLELPNLPAGGDVADWLVEGHTIAELRRLAAATPIITAPSSPAQNSRRAFQDALTEETQKTCSGCERREEQNRRLGKLLRLASNSLVNLRRERAVEGRYLKLPTSKASAPVKAAAILMRRELTAPTLCPPEDGTPRHDERGRELVFRANLASWLGCSESTASKQLGKLCELGLLRRESETRGFNDTVFYYELGPLAETPEAVEDPKPAANGWGGKRPKACPYCKSTKLIATAYVCTGCGMHLRDDELIELDEEDTLEAEQEQANAATPTADPPETPIVEQDGPHAMNSGSADVALSLPRCVESPDGWAEFSQLRASPHGPLLCVHCGQSHVQSA